MNRAIAVLYFTDGPEAEASEATADDMLEALGNKGLRVPLTQETWVRSVESLGQDTICLLATHGGTGENGTLQGWLESLGIRHSHSQASISAVLYDKHAMKLVYRALGINTPGWMFNGQFISTGGTEKPPVSYIQKPRFGGSKIGIKRVRNIQRSLDDTHIYEEAIAGEAEVSVAVLYDGTDYHALDPIERKRTDVIGELQVATDIVSKETLQKCQEQAVMISRHIGTRGIVKTDFLIDESGEVWALETDAIPGLSRQNASALAAERSGITYGELMNMLIKGVA